MTHEIHALARRRVERYWAHEIGCSIDALLTPGLRVIVRSTGSDALVFRYYESCLWRVPARFAAGVQSAIAGHDGADGVFNEGFIIAQFGSAIERILGPASIAYCDDTTFQPQASLPPARQLTAADHLWVERLAAACGPAAWSDGGIELGEQAAVFGCFAEGQLVSAASYEIWRHEIAHVCVATAPTFRGRGLAKSAAAAATAAALAASLVPQWRTLVSNAASLAVGQALGFRRLAGSFLVQFAPQ